ncbi:MAG: hypothetical protein ABSD71_12810 [Bacteroidales bacterium]|jgi:hypothetical protein
MNLIKTDLSLIKTQDVRKRLLLDIVALIVVFSIPKIGQYTHLPFWMIEPMRLMVVLSLAHATKANSYLLALFLPVFSWAVSGHPEFIKMVVMTGELAVNVFLFYFLIKEIQSIFQSMIISIALSKVLCYACYLLFFSQVFIQEETEPTYLIAQVISTLVFSFYVYWASRKKFQ